MPYSARDYEYLFNIPTELGETQIEKLRHKDVFRYRVKTIRSGNMLECEIYPLWKTRNNVREARDHVTRLAQRNLNEKNAKKNLIRKINANFTEEDIFITLTYKGVVPDEEQARKDMRNYIRRVRAYRRKHKLSEIKYVYVIEFGRSEDGRRKRVHHHLIMSGMDRDTAESLWRNGRANTMRLQPDEYGLEGLTRYIVKESKGSKRWASSRNLVEPVVTKSDTKLSKRQVERLVKDVEEAPAAIFCKLYPGYGLNSCDIKHSDFVVGTYIYVNMTKNTTNRRDYNAAYY